MARTKHSVVKANTNFDHSCIPRIAARKSAPPLHGIPPKKRFAAEIMEEIEQLKAMLTKGAAVACEVKTEPPADVVAEQTDADITTMNYKEKLIQMKDKYHEPVKAIIAKFDSLLQNMGVGEEENKRKKMEDVRKRFGVLLNMLNEDPYNLEKQKTKAQIGPPAQLL